MMAKKVVQDVREGVQGKGPRLLSCSKTKCTFIAIEHIIH